MKIDEVKLDLAFVHSDAVRVLKAPEGMETECHEVTDLLNAVIKPESLIALYNDMEVGMTSISLGGMRFECGSKIAAALQGSTAAAVFVATLGSDVTDLYNKFNGAKDYLKAYWLDILANAAVDRMAERIRGSIAESASRSGLSSTSNWAPGYCQWKLTDQFRLLDLVPGAERLVTLTESMLMQPMKSLTGIIGIGKKVKYHVSNCTDCALDSCFYRNQCR